MVPAIGSVFGVTGSGAPEREGARHERPRIDPLPNAGDGFRQARRDAESRYKFGEDLRAENPEYALQFTNEDSLKLPRRGLGANSLWPRATRFSCIPQSCASTRAAIAVRSCTAA